MFRLRIVNVTNSRNKLDSNKKWHLKYIFPRFFNFSVTFLPSAASFIVKEELLCFWLGAYVLPLAG